MSKRSGCKFLSLVAGLGLGVLGASNAHASFTKINPPAKGEVSIAGIFSDSYGGTFKSSGVNFSNGTVEATRVHQSDVPVEDIVSATTLATFASFSQGFGYEVGTKVTDLFSVSGKGFSASGSVGAVNLPTTYDFVRTGKGFVESSDPSKNADKKDHLVTYLLSGKGISPDTYVLFFEDKTVKQKSDFDFNDLAVEVKFKSPAVVPLPAAAWSGLVTLAGGVLVTGYRKNRRQMA